MCALPAEDSSPFGIDNYPRCEACSDARGRALSLRRPVASLRSLLGNRRWLAGIGLEAVGWLLYVGALALAPLFFGGGIGGILGLIYRGLYTVLVTTSVYYRLGGIEIRTIDNGVDSICPEIKLSLLIFLKLIVKLPFFRLLPI